MKLGVLSHDIKHSWRSHCKWPPSQEMLSTYTKQYNLVQYSTIRYDTIQYDTMLYNAILTIQYYGMQSTTRNTLHYSIHHSSFSELVSKAFDAGVKKQKLKEVIPSHNPSILMHPSTHTRRWPGKNTLIEIRLEAQQRSHQSSQTWSPISQQRSQQWSQGRRDMGWMDG